MIKILIYSNNNNLIDKCTKALAAHYQINQLKELRADCNADIIIIDSKHVDNNPEILNLVKNHPALFLLAGTRWAEEKQVNAILHSVAGYYDETEPDALLIKAIESILYGDIWLKRHLIPKVIRSLIDTKQADSKVKQNSASAELLKTLSSREMDVAKMIRTGESNKQIARSLNISERTVKAHLTSIFKKLNVTDRLHLAILLKENDD